MTSKSIGSWAKATRQDLGAMATRLSRDERNAIAQRIFASLCAHYPKHYVTLIESKAAANPPARSSTETLSVLGKVN
jgi:hypothetical protein